MLQNIQNRIIGYVGGKPVYEIRGGAPEDTPPVDPPAFTAPSSQAELDRIIGERLSRERQKFADYEDLKQKAVKYDEHEEQSKSDLEKANERAQAAEARAQLAERTAARADVALVKGVPSALLSGATREELEASADALIAFRGASAPTPPPATLTPLPPGFQPGAAPVGTEKSVAAGAALYNARKTPSTKE